MTQCGPHRGSGTVQEKAKTGVPVRFIGTQCPHETTAVTRREAGDCSHRTLARWKAQLSNRKRKTYRIVYRSWKGPDYTNLGGSGRGLVIGQTNTIPVASSTRLVGGATKTLCGNFNCGKLLAIAYACIGKSEKSSHKIKRDNGEAWGCHVVGEARREKELVPHATINTIILRYCSDIMLLGDDKVLFRDL